MSNSKRIYSFLIILVTTLLLAACSNTTPEITKEPKSAIYQAGDLGVALTEPADTIDVAHFTNGVGLNGRDNNEFGMLSARSFQGLINKTIPRLYIERVGQDKWGIMTEPLKKEAIRTVGNRNINELPNDTNPAHTGYYCFWSIFYKYHGEINKLYVFEEYSANDKLYAVMNIAVMLAGRDNSVAVSRPLAEQIKNEGFAFEEVDVEEYCGFTFSKDNTITINQWAIDNLLKESNKNMVFALCPQVRTWYAGMTESDQFPSSYDMAVALDAFIYTPIPYTPAGLQIEEKVLSFYDDGIPVIGWPGPYENTWVSHIAKCNKIVVSIDWEYNNGSLWCAFPPFESHEKLAPIPENFNTYDDTVYIAFEYSDGDAFHYCERDLIAHLNNPVIMETNIPMGWSIPSIWQKFNPVLLEYYYSLRREGLDEFIQGPSGVSYTYPSMMSSESYTLFLNRTKEMFGNLGINMTSYWDITPGNSNSMVGVDETLLKKYIEIVKPEAIFRGQSSHTGDYKVIDGVVCIEKVGNFSGSGCQTAGDIISSVHKMVERQKTSENALRPNGPVFIMIDVNAWGDPIETVVPVAVRTLLAEENAHYEFVTPSELVAAIYAYENNSTQPNNPKFQ